MRQSSSGRLLQGQYSTSYDEHCPSAYVFESDGSTGNLYTPRELTVDAVSEPKRNPFGSCFMLLSYLYTR